MTNTNFTSTTTVVLLLAISATPLACTSSLDRLYQRGDELLYLGRYEEAARQFELVLHECGDKNDVNTVALKSETLFKIGELKHFYLNDQDGALRTYRRITEIAPAGELAFKTRERIIKLMKSRSTETELLKAEIEMLMAKYPDRVQDDKWNLELAQLMLDARKYKKAESYAQKAIRSKSLAQRARAALLIASSQELDGRVAFAKNTYESLLKEASLPNDLRQITLVSVAHCLEKMGQLRAAHVAYQDARKETKNPRFLNDRILRIERLIAEQKDK